MKKFIAISEEVKAIEFNGSNQKDVIQFGGDYIKERIDEYDNSELFLISGEIEVPIPPMSVIYVNNDGVLRKLPSGAFYQTFKEVPEPLLSFEEAIEYAKKGIKVARKDWGKDKYLFIKDNIDFGNGIIFGPEVFIKEDDGRAYFYKFNIEDVINKDWREI